MRDDKVVKTTDNKLDSRIEEEKRKRINRLKTIIIFIVLTLTILPTICCIFLGIHVFKLQNQVNDLLSLKDSGNQSYELSESYESNSNTIGEFAFDSTKLQEKLVQQAPTDNKEQFSKNIIGQYTNDTTGQLAYNITGQLADNITGQPTNNITGQIANNITEQLTEDTQGLIPDLLAGQTGAENNTVTDSGETAEVKGDYIEEPKADEDSNLTETSSKNNVDTELTEAAADSNQEIAEPDNPVTNQKLEALGKKSEIESSSIGIYSGKKVYLTFDDGPSIYSNKILDILAQYNVKATFFVTGKKDQDSKKIYQRIVNEGHTLGMHSYSHVYKQIYKSEEDFDKDFTKLWKLLYDTTGYKPTIYRFPGGSSNQVNDHGMDDFIRYLRNKSIYYYDWNVVSGDATGIEYTKDQLIDNVLKGVAIKGTSIVLMHDVRTKGLTVDSLPELLEALISGGAEILPLDEDVPPIQQIKADSIK